MAENFGPSSAKRADIPTDKTCRSPAFYFLLICFQVLSFLQGTQSVFRMDANPLRRPATKSAGINSSRERKKKKRKLCRAYYKLWIGRFLWRAEETDHQLSLSLNRNFLFEEKRKKRESSFVVLRAHLIGFDS